MRKLLLVTTALMALSTAPALADVVYTSALNIDHCTGTCGPTGTTFATLTLTDTLAGMTFSIDPADGVAFNLNGNAFATFNFSSSATLATTDFTLPANYQVILGPRNQDGFGTFNVGVDHIGNGAPQTANLVFSVDGLNFSDLTASVDGKPSVFFTVDVLGLNDKTGLIGGDPVMTAVPEPATWAMMLLGFAGVGFMAYRKKAGASFRFA